MEFSVPTIYHMSSETLSEIQRLLHADVLRRLGPEVTEKLEYSGVVIPDAITITFIGDHKLPYAGLAHFEMRKQFDRLEDEYAEAIGL